MFAKRTRRSGFVLLLALLILFVVVAIAAGLARVVASGLTITRGINNAIPAYFTAESAVERGLWRIVEARRSGRTLSDTLTLLNAPGDLIPGTTPVSVARLSAQSPSTVVIPFVRANDSATFDLFDPDSLGVGSGVRTLRLSALDAGDSASRANPSPWLEVTRVDLSDISNPFAPESLLFTDAAQTTPLAVEDCVPGCDLTFTSGSRYRVRVTALYGDIRNLTASAFNDGGTPTPFLGVLEVRAVGSVPNATNSQAQQALTASVNWLTPASPLFDYTLFSEEILDKR